MNCEQVARRLSEYLDRSLDPASTGKIESHLASCDRCRAEADLLLECTRQVAALSQVEPPIAFAQRIIAHVKELETKPSFWESLFLPFKANLPIQATAVVLIGIVALYIAEQEPHRKLIRPSRQTFAVSDKEERPLTIASTNEPSRLQRQKIPPVDEASKTGKKPILESDQKHGSSTDVLDRERGSQKERALQPQAQGRVAEPSRSLDSRLDSRAAARVADASGPLQPDASQSKVGIAQLRQKTRVTPTIPVVSDPKGMSPAYAPRRSRDLLELMTAGPLGPALVPSEFPRLSIPVDVELVVRRRPEQSTQTGDSTEPSARSGSVNVPREQVGRSIESLLLSLRESATRQTMWVALPHDQYDRLKSELLRLGTIESESRNLPLSSDTASATDADPQLRLMLIVLPADDGGGGRTAGSPSR
jgi:Putative zinc-finger